MSIAQRVQSNVRILITMVAFLFVATMVAINAQPVAAQNAAANTLKVSPVRSDIEVKPGESKVVTATVTNLTDEDIVVRPVANDFVSGDERGTPALILDENQFAPTHSLKRFMGPLTDVTIPANEAKQVEVTITVPADTQAGGYFGAVRFAPASPEDGGQVNLSASVASLILLKVPGDAVEKLDLSSFSIQQNGKTNTNFRTPDDLQVSARFVNKGNVQVGPFGKISVKSGDKVVYDTEFNDKNPRDMILPDSARRWDIPLDNIGDFGKYTVHAVFTYGDNNQTIEVSKSFWVIPQIVIIGAIVGLILLIALIAGIWFYINKRRKHRRGDHYRRQS